LTTPAADFGGVSARRIVIRHCLPANERHCLDHDISRERAAAPNNRGDLIRISAPRRLHELLMWNSAASIIRGLPRPSRRPRAATGSTLGLKAKSSGSKLDTDNPTLTAVTGDRTTRLGCARGGPAGGRERPPSALRLNGSREPCADPSARRRPRAVRTISLIGQCSK
jgi:hypothetical protein